MFTGAEVLSLATRTGNSISFPSLGKSDRSVLVEQVQLLSPHAVLVEADVALVGPVVGRRGWRGGRRLRLEVVDVAGDALDGRESRLRLHRAHHEELEQRRQLQHNDRAVKHKNSMMKPELFLLRSFKNRATKRQRFVETARFCETCVA